MLARAFYRVPPITNTRTTRYNDDFDDTLISYRLKRIGSRRERTRKTDTNKPRVRHKLLKRR